MIFLKKVLQKNYKLFAIYLVIKHLLIGGHGSNMVKNISVQPKDIYKDPYGYTYSEMVSVLGENEAGKIYRELYSRSKNTDKYDVGVKSPQFCCLAHY